MKRTILAVGLTVSMLFVYNGWVDVELPQSAIELNNDLDQHALAYEVVNGTPLIVAMFGDAVFLDTIQLERISMNVPPYPQWQWTGNWERVQDPDAAATASLSAEFGPTVLFGVINEESITSMHIVREGNVILEASLDDDAYIIPVADVKLTDTVIFLDDQGNAVLSVSLM